MTNFELGENVYSYNDFQKNQVDHAHLAKMANVVLKSHLYHQLNNHSLILYLIESTKAPVSTKG